jgi:alanine-synthesizing transaminase
VSPNNPTGSMLRQADRDWLAELAASRGLALISDEVFADYVLCREPDAASLAGEARALTFTLGGLSKSAGLPQVKLAWAIVSGPAALKDEAKARLEVICDTYLSVSTPVQVAAPSLLAHGWNIQLAILERLTRNLAALCTAAEAFPSITVLEPEGGWSAVLRVPATMTEEALALRLLEEDHVVVHPGYFFDFTDEAFLVVSLLPDPATFDEGILRVLRRAGGETA